MKAPEYRMFLKGLLMGLARGPVDDAIIEMIVSNAPGQVHAAVKEYDVIQDDILPPPPADDPESAFEQDVLTTPEQIRQAVKAQKGQQKVKAPQPNPRARGLFRPKESTSKLGTDEDLKDAFSGGEVLRLG